MRNNNFQLFGPIHLAILASIPLLAWVMAFVAKRWPSLATPDSGHRRRFAADQRTDLVWIQDPKGLVSVSREFAAAVVRSDFVDDRDCDDLAGAVCV